MASQVHCLKNQDRFNSFMHDATASLGLIVEHTYHSFM